MRILNTIGQVLTPEARAILEGVGCLDDRALSQGELAEVIGEYDAALVGLGLTFDSRVLARAEKLRVIATATTGLDHIDLNAALVRDIEVLSLRGEEEFLNTITGTAELAFGMLIDLARRVPWAFESVRRYEWNREAFRGHSLSGKTLGIVGLGRLGRIMARQAAGFGMRVIFFDPYVRASSPRFFGKTPDVDRARGHAAFYAAASNGVEDLLRNKASGVRGGQADEAEEEAEEGQTLLSQCRGGSDPPRAGAFTAKAEKVDFDELLRESDAVSIHAHLTPETEGMFGEREFALMKPSVYLINTS
ncbi:MAG: NAD(P)-dependent oxidoreductase, partial [Patescibacteria group bacterium]|nr:NAD(P)-dependent oxidoreductase [Patescibacteria group bacterium]